MYKAALLKKKRKDTPCVSSNNVCFEREVAAL